MASGSLVGGAAGGEGSREKHRWTADSKVYTRKSHSKNHPKPSSGATGSDAPRPPPPAPSSKQTLATTTDDVHSSLQQPPLPPHHRRPRSAASDDNASSLNHGPPPDPSKNHSSRRSPNGQHRVVTISLAARPRHEVRVLRRRLIAELEQVRSLVKRFEARESQPSTTAAPASQLSVNEVITPLSSKRAAANSEAASTTAAPLRRQLGVSVPENSVDEPLEKEKRTPKANQLYRNSDFVLGKEKFPVPELHGHKKSKANGSKKHSMGEMDCGAQMVDKMLDAHALNSCSALLQKLMKHKYAWVFNTPVDVKGLGLNDYYNIIKHPMDLGTVKSRLSKNWYKTPSEFAEDVRLTFRNAVTYNPKGQDAHFMAEQLSQIFEQRWPAIEAEYTYLSHPPPPTITTTKKAQQVDMRRTLEMLDSTVHTMLVDLKPQQVNYTRHLGRPPALKKPKAKDPNKRDMTFEEKQRLSRRLQSLPSEKLDNIVQIIKKRNSSLSQHDDEIEVDIDSVDAETLWELDRFVTNYKKSLSKNKRKAELANLARAQAKHQTQERMQEKIPDAGVLEVPKESKTVDGENAASMSLVGGEKKGASRSNSSTSSSSDSGSSSGDSDSESSSGYGSDAAHSPRT
ncbi:transcription factor GTE4-like [Phoenix dactylifera]|uniref:Transcription factor GTE4-like n=1 Tax=Phoenix dactylifera TaxID=42345 RepID=A0A8B7BGE6_PHODC|nr:transcription factor GTE4-like [Phoenix dactylifera]